MTCQHPHRSHRLRLEGDAVWNAPDIAGFTAKREGCCNVVLILCDCWQVKCTDCGQQWYEVTTNDAA